MVNITLIHKTGIDRESAEYQRGYKMGQQKGGIEVADYSHPHFLAGAITGSYDWHKRELWSRLGSETRRLEDLGTLLVFEPRD